MEDPGPKIHPTFFDVIGQDRAGYEVGRDVEELDPPTSRFSEAFVAAEDGQLVAVVWIEVRGWERLRLGLGSGLGLE